MLSARRAIEASPPTTQSHTRQTSNAEAKAPSQSAPAPASARNPLIKLDLAAEAQAQKTVQLSLPPDSKTRVDKLGAEAREQKRGLEVTGRAGESGLSASGSSGSGVDMGTVRPKKPLTVYDEAVLKVQEWNEALNGEICICRHRRRMLFRNLAHIHSRSQASRQTPPPPPSRPPRQNTSIALIRFLCGAQHANTPFCRQPDRTAIIWLAECAVERRGSQGPCTITVHGRREACHSYKSRRSKRGGCGTQQCRLAI